MKMILGYCILIFFTTSSCNMFKDKKEKESFKFIDKYIDESCTLYLTYFHKGDYIYRVETMDSCNDLTKEKYIAAYDTLISDNFDEFLIKKGKIIFGIVGLSFANDSLFRKSLIGITEKKFNTISIIIENSFDSFIIELK